MTQFERKQLYKEAHMLLDKIENLLLTARAKHEAQTSKKAA